VTLLHLLRKQLKWKDKETEESEKKLSLERLTQSVTDTDPDSDGSDPPEIQVTDATPPDQPGLASQKDSRAAQKDDSASVTVIKTLIHVAATSNEGYERDRAILSITGGNNIVDALKILVDPAFLSAQASHTSEIYDITDSNARNVAHYAVSMGNLGCVEYLTSAAPDLFTRKDSSHRTPAYIAAALGQSECLRLIARFVPDCLRETDGNGVSPAHASALQGEFECVKILAKCAPHLFYETEASGKTPAHIAVFADMADVIEAIAQAVPESLKIPDADQFTPAHIAIMYGKKGCLKAIKLYAPESMLIPSGRGITAAQMLTSDSGPDGQPREELEPPTELALQKDVYVVEAMPSEPEVAWRIESAQTVDKVDQIQAEEILVEEIKADEIPVVQAEEIEEVVVEHHASDMVHSLEDEITMLKRLLKESLQLETFLDDLRRQAELLDFEQDSLGVAFKLNSGSVLAMTNNGSIFSAIYSDSQSSTTILVEALTGGVGRVVEKS
jgi:ankyrin repeat protein